jgi:hypothetical protein
VLGGALRDVKKKYGTNSVHLEFEGDGSFLKQLPMVKKADVYQNYAELELVDIGRATDLLGKLDTKLNLTKFEVVEPSLNSIFVSVVGIPKEPEVKAEDLQLAPKGKRMDPRLKKSLFSVSIPGAVTLALAIGMLFKDDPNWGLVGIMVAATLVSGYKFLQMKRLVENEKRTSSGNMP